MQSLAFATQHAKRMLLIVIGGLVGSYHIFPHCLIHGTIFEGKIFGHKMCFSLQLLSATFLFLRRIQRNICVLVFIVKYTSFFVRL